MSTIKTFIKSRPVLTYFALTFAISWCGVLLAIGGPGRIPGTPDAFAALLPFVGLAMMAGPPVAGILLTGLSGGRAGFREFLSRLLRWRRWVTTTGAAVRVGCVAVVPRFMYMVRRRK
jgi:uncharacterized protein